MSMAFLCCLPLLCAGVGEDCLSGSSYVVRCDCGMHRCEPYDPQPGDLVFFDKPNRLWDVLDFIARTKAPDHLGMVVAMPDGSLAMLEAGPDAQPRVYLSEVLCRLHSFKGRIYVRRLRCPLSPEQSDALTDFALRQEGKRYSGLRLMRQITPFRTRGPVRTQLFGATIMDRRRWICSDLIITAGAAAGLFDPKAMPASAIYAYDVLHDRTYDLSGCYESWGRWSPCPLEGEAAAEYARLRPLFRKISP